MNKELSFREIEGKKLATPSELENWYLGKLKTLKSENKNFLEIDLVINEREEVKQLLSGFNPADKEESNFRRFLFHYLGGFLNRRLLVAEEEIKRHPDNFENSVNEVMIKEYDKLVKDFEDKMKVILDKEIQIDFLNNEIKESRTTIQNWLSDGIVNSKNYYYKGHFQAGQKYLSYLKNQLEILDNRIYFIKNGKQVLSNWDYANQTGIATNLKQKYNCTLNPTHDYNLLKETRLLQFHEFKEKTLEERKLNHLETTTNDHNLIYTTWLNRELTVIDVWLSDKHPNGDKRKERSTSEQIEINKYKYFVQNEIEIIKPLLNTNIQTLKTQSKTKSFNEPQTFAEIFSTENFEKYISALEKTTPNLIDKNREFIGGQRKHKGVVCSWIKYLQNSGIIKQSVNRSQLALVLNNELKNFNLGNDGKTFDNISNEFENNFRQQLINLTKQLP